MTSVLIIAEFGAFGGTRDYLKRLLRFYADQGYQISLAATPTTIDTEIRTLIGEIDARVVDWPLSAGQWSRRWSRFPWRMPIDLVIASLRLKPWSYGIVTVSVGTPWLYWGLAWLPIRMLYILHTAPPAGWLEHGLRRASRRLIDVRLSTRRRLLAVSNDMYKILAGSWVQGPRHRFITVLHNTAGPSMKNSLEPPATASPLTVLTLGHLEEYKAPEIWLKVAEAVLDKFGPEQVRFVWAGDGSLYDELKSEIDKRDTKGLELLGFVEDAASLHESSDIYFQPSRLESHGISVLEAMRIGRPCVVSNAGGLPESVEHELNGFVCRVDDVQAMTDALLTLLRSPAQRYHYGEASRRLYNERFSEECWSEWMTSLHEQIMFGSSACS